MSIMKIIVSIWYQNNVNTDENNSFNLISNNINS